MKILLLEDDALLGELISERLRLNNTVSHFSDGNMAMDSICKEKFDLLLLDVDVPGIDGFSLLELIRNANIQTPTIFLTAKTTSKDLKKGFDVGGNDYIRKPFDFDELEARIAYIKKQYRLDSKIELGNEAWLNEKTILIKDSPHHISQKESEILKYLVQNNNRYVSYDELTSAVWTLEDSPSQATIRTYIKNLRSILGADSIGGERGIGWRYDRL